MSLDMNAAYITSIQTRMVQTLNQMKAEIMPDIVETDAQHMGVQYGPMNTSNQEWGKVPKDVRDRWDSTPSNMRMMEEASDGTIMLLFWPKCLYHLDALIQSIRLEVNTASDHKVGQVDTPLTPFAIGDTFYASSLKSKG